MKSYLTVTLHCDEVPLLVKMYYCYCEPDSPYDMDVVNYKVCELIHKSIHGNLPDDLDENLIEILTKVTRSAHASLLKINWEINDCVAVVMIESNKDLLFVYEA